MTFLFFELRDWLHLSSCDFFVVTTFLVKYLHQKKVMKFFLSNLLVPGPGKAPKILTFPNLASLPGFSRFYATNNVEIISPIKSLCVAWVRHKECK
jgi:hypothetical protein